MFKALPILLVAIAFSEVSFARSAEVQCDGYKQKMKIELSGEQTLNQAKVTLLRSRPKAFELPVEAFVADLSASAPSGYGQERNVIFRENLNLPSEVSPMEMYQYDSYDLVLPRYVTESKKLSKRLFKVELNSSDDRYIRGLVGLFTCQAQN